MKKFENMTIKELDDRAFKLIEELTAIREIMQRILGTLGKVSAVTSGNTSSIKNTDSKFFIPTESYPSITHKTEDFVQDGGEGEQPIVGILDPLDYNE